MKRAFPRPVVLHRPGPPPPCFALNASAVGRAYVTSRTLVKIRVPRPFADDYINAAPLLPEDYSDEDVSTDRQMYRKTNIMKENMFQHGIDNPTLEKEPPSQIRNESKA